MNKLPKDVVELITNKLTPREFFNYCKSEEAREFCERKDIWLRRIQKDFGFLLEGKNKDIFFPDFTIDPKKSYLELFIKTSSAAEEIKDNILQNIGKYFLLNFTKDNYIGNVYNFFFNYLLRMLNHIDVDLEDDDDENYEEVGDQVIRYFWDFDEWKKYLPVYHSNMSDMWSEEIVDVLAKYAIEIFPS